MLCSVAVMGNNFQELGHQIYPKFKKDLIEKFIDNYYADGKKMTRIMQGQVATCPCSVGLRK